MYQKYHSFEWYFFYNEMYLNLENTSTGGDEFKIVFRDDARLHYIS